jgi:pyruvate,water dikinase
MIVTLSEAHDASVFGGKAAQLAHALVSGLPVPGGVAIAWERSDRFDVDVEVAAAEIAARVDLSRGVAVRSSAVGEDSAGASFAGQHLTVLGVRSARRLVEALREVWASARTAAAMAYRKKLGLDQMPKMGIVVQSLVHAEAAGVLFSRCPMTKADVRTIEASWGLGEAVVCGLVTPDRFKVARGGRVLERHPGDKDLAIRWADDGEGTVEVEVEPHLVDQLCLDDAQLSKLDELVTRCETVFGGSQDIEFAFERGTLHLLQRRAITRE